MTKDLIQAPLPGDLVGLDDYLWNQAEAAESIESRVILEEWRLGLRALSADNARLREEREFKEIMDGADAAIALSTSKGGEE